MPESDAQTRVLMAALEAARQELQAMENLLQDSRDNPLRALGKTIRPAQFGSAEIVRSFDDMQTAIDKKCECEAWAHYAKARQALMDFSGDLLGVIGGVYVKDNVLDDVRRNPPSGEDLKTKKKFSFSTLATELVADVASRSDMPWQSVLIVGEERSRISKADVIRLRFPAWDLWNLPMTAHEYGYLRARGEQLRPQLAEFNAFKTEIRNAVNPAGHDDGKRPDNWTCFLPEVRKFWDQCDSACRNVELASRAQGRESFAAAHKAEIQELTERQDDFVCRLFADTFATFFVGPAYVQALMNLRLTPDRMVNSGPTAAPPLALRFVFALKTLIWMDDRKVLDPRGAPEVEHPFRDEVLPGAGLRFLWNQSLPASLGSATSDLVLERTSSPPEWYADFEKQFEPWWNRMRDSLRRNMRTTDSITKTYTNWEAAQALAKVLSADAQPQKLPGWPEKWPVLNAAWLARRNRPAFEEVIYERAAQLLGRVDKAYVRKPPSTRVGE